MSFGVNLHDGPHLAMVSPESFLLVVPGGCTRVEELSARSLPEAVAEAARLGYRVTYYLRQGIRHEIDT